MAKKVNPIEDGPAVRRLREMRAANAKAAAPKPTAKKAAAPAKASGFSLRGALNARKKAIDDATR